MEKENRKEKYSNNFVYKPFILNKEYNLILSTHKGHLSLRWKERMGEEKTDIQCLEYLKPYFEDERIIGLFSRVNLYDHIALFIEDIPLWVFFQVGTKLRANEVKISTIRRRKSPNDRALVEENDLCYILPKEGKLRFGVEKKYFSIKKR